jgi:hypothetical protein
MKTPILGQAYVARSVNAADNRMVNLFPEVIPDGGKEPAFLNRAPGLRLLATIGDGPIRGMWQFGNFGYVVSGSTLYQVSSTWSATALGAVAGIGPVSMADNGTQLFIAANPTGYIYNSTTSAFQQITDSDFPGAVMVGYLDGYFVFNEPNSQKVWVTSLLEGTQVDPLDFASAEGSPDGLVSLIIDHREVWLFGTNSVEVWYDAGLPDFPLSPIQGAYNEVGCAAAYSVAKMDNSVFWLGSDARGNGIVYRANGYQAQRISTHAVEFAIQNYGVISDARGYTYQQEGHSFYALVFPSAGKTWVYDASTSAWHERAAFEYGQFTQQRPICQMNFNREIVVGDYASGKIYAYDLDVYTDDDQPQKWLRSWRALPTGQNNLKRTVQHAMQLDCETGVGSGGVSPFENFFLETESGDLLTTESGFYLTVVEVSPSFLQTQGSNPQVMLRWSDDGGHTWSNEHWASLGKIGKYGHRAIWRRLGTTLKIRDRVYEVSGTDPVKIAILGAELQIAGTNA